MEWIMQQEGITADAEALSVLAQAGEGSVRDSLSALDQAIACCGNKLEAGEVRELLGMFSLESLGPVATALAAGDSQSDARRGGRSGSERPQPATFRARAGSLFPQSAGGEDRGEADATGRRIATGAGADARGRQQFSEEDLTRYLQLTLDLFRDLQSSLQPRLHLEMGLLRLVHAGRLQPIEEALLAGRRRICAAENRGHDIAARPGLLQKPLPPTPQDSARKPAAVPQRSGSIGRRRLSDPPARGAARSQAHARRRRAGTLRSRRVASRDYVHDTQDVPDVSEAGEFEAAVKRVAGRPVRITIKVGEAVAAAPAATACRNVERRRQPRVRWRIPK